MLVLLGPNGDNLDCERVRRPPPALVWTEHGRGVVPRIVLRMGSVVHREVLARVPNGFDGEQEKDLEDRTSWGEIP